LSDGKKRRKRTSIQTLIQAIQNDLIEDAPPGSKILSIRRIAKRYGVSLSLANYAISQLARDGFVEVRNRSGVYVRPHSRKPRRVNVGFAYWDHSEMGVCHNMISFFLYGMRQILSSVFYNIHLFPFKSCHFVEQYYNFLVSAELDYVVFDGAIEPYELSFLKEHNIKPIFVGTFGEELDAVTVLVDWVRGLRQILEHLYRLGHRDIAFVHGNVSPDEPVTLEFVRTVKEFASEKGFRIPDERIIECRTAAVGGKLKEIGTIFERPMPSAVVFVNEEACHHFLFDCCSRGIRCPGDVSVASVFNAFLSHYRGFLTCLDSNSATVEQGEKVARMIHNGSFESVEHLKVLPRLVAGKSTAPIK